jgi:hypothetical protein
MNRIRKELAARTPWRVFLSHPVALCLLAANFQYVGVFFSLQFIVEGRSSVVLR